MLTTQMMKNRSYTYPRSLEKELDFCHKQSPVNLNLFIVRNTLRAVVKEYNLKNNTHYTPWKVVKAYLTAIYKWKRVY